MLRNPNLTIEDIRAVHALPASDASDELVGPRPSWWWSGQAPVHGQSASIAPNGKIISLPMPNLATCTREEVFDYFANGWLLNEVFFSGLRGVQAFIQAPYHGLRHPMIFYYGHTACLFVNKLLVAGLIDKPVNDYFERIFEVGVDEMSWDDMSKNEMTWPDVKAVNAYRHDVFRVVADLIAAHPDLAEGHAPITAQHPLWALFMSMEHERIHLETSSVLVREMPLSLLQRPAAWPDSYIPAVPAAPLQENVMLPVTRGQVALGKPSAWPSYGWDNEYGARTAGVDDFAISRFMVTNGEFLAFMKDNGYQESRFWTEQGWKWRTYRNNKWPTFWVSAGPAGLHEYRLRTIFDVVDLPLDWPVCVNCHEARAFLAWKSEKDGRIYRLPTEAEHAYLRRGAAAAAPMTVLDAVMAADSSVHQREHYANANLAFGSEVPVHWSQPGPFGVHDIAGNLWDWCEDDFNPLDGFKVHPLYDDFSTPCFDGEHTMILGGSFMSTGDEASAWSRFHFRPHFFQHAGFHVVAPTKAASGAVRLKQGNASKYEIKSVLDQYLLFHFGDAAATLPAGVAVATGRFPQRCAAKLIELAKQHDCGFSRALDVGCAVGGASFELEGAYDKVIGVDISAQFIETAEALRTGAKIPYKIVMEGDIYDIATAQAPAQVNPDHVQFRRADACSLPAEYADFDAVLAGNLLCRLPSPKAFLSRMGGPRGLVKPGGIVMFASPFSWMEQFTTKSAWLGGTEGVDGRHWSADGLQEALGGEFELVHREDFPFMIREHRRKFEYVVSDLTVWLRKM